jgi:formate/nitrite transporter FocA (FNT family)
MKEIFKLITKSILAGVLIALAGIVYLSCSDKVVGSFLFSFGLCLVIILEANLYTGKVGYVKSVDDLTDVLMMFGINILSAYLVGLLSGMGPMHDSAAALVTTKLETEWWITLLKSIGCGICIYGSVEGYKKTKSFIPVILGVMCFILAGFNHVVADAFYIGAARFGSVEVLQYLLLVAIGNAIGSILIRLLQRGWKDELPTTK